MSTHMPFRHRRDRAQRRLRLAHRVAVAGIAIAVPLAFWAGSVTTTKPVGLAAVTDAMSHNAYGARPAPALDMFDKPAKPASKPRAKPKPQAKPDPQGAQPEQRRCDLGAPVEFGPDGNTIVNRDCGYTDATGREQSMDPWIDGQLLEAQKGKPAPKAPPKPKIDPRKDPGGWALYECQRQTGMNAEQCIAYSKSAGRTDTTDVRR
jgi:hypothetical protein